MSTKPQTPTDPLGIMKDIVIMDDSLILAKDNDGVTVYTVPKETIKEAQDKYLQKHEVTRKDMDGVNRARKEFNKEFYGHAVEMVEDIWKRQKTPGKVEIKAPINDRGTVIVRANPQDTIRIPQKNGKALEETRPTLRFVEKTSTGVTGSYKKEVQGNLNDIYNKLSS